ncbi:hypothetical protein BX666DRAFT_1850871 [Dichotomocladium elegans]|nr:hypothetical protein BX666DRAFT_1850871 [Dichotomocladium elegans]
MNSFVKKTAINRVVENIQNRPSVVESDPEIRAAVEEAMKSTKKHWWKRRPEADIILNPQDRQILRTVKKRAWYLDRGFQCCCFQVGLDGVIGLIPFIGDFVGVLLALYLVRVAARADLPNHILLKMLTNVFVDFILGLTPIAGDILDVLFQCNWRNALILEEYLFLRRRDQIRAELGAAGYGSTQTHDSPGSSTRSAPPPPITTASNYPV